ncbi:MAG: methyltransferase type 11 [Flavobacteriales bacterium]|nr:MAG: methyltransferase type 11 [Flavobacteriales bacterium]
MYVQYGCGSCAPKDWINFDASPTLKVQKTPVVGFLLRKKLNAIFPENAKCGDIVKGLPIKEKSCDGVFCSHVLEHLSYEDFIKAIVNTHKILKPNGIFRLVMPDLENLISSYIKNKEDNNREAATHFVKNTLMGQEKRTKGMRALLESIFGNSRHLWLWDKDAAIVELEKVGFKAIRACEFNDCEDEMFKLVESEDRFQGSIGLEMRK